MRRIDLRSIDLNLLVVLDVLLEERSVSRTARRIGRTQSATSHALARLRDALDDPLLVRIGGDMRPTPRAERLQADLRRVLRSLSRVLEGDVDFEPSSTKRVFTLAGPDFLAGYAAPITSGLRSMAPGAAFELALPTPGMFQDLIDARLDLVVCPRPRNLQDGAESVPLSRLGWVVFARAGHPAALRWGAKAWGHHHHLQIRTGGAPSPVDALLETLGRKRTIAAWLPSFHLAAPLIADSDLLLTAPHATLGAQAERYGLLVLRCPFRLPPIELSVHYAAYRQRDPALIFFLDVVRAAFEGDRGR